MSRIEKTHYFNNQPVQYMFSPAKQDRNHLIVIFSGFAVDYDFIGNTAEGCRANILWIKDYFHGDNAYYICVEKDFTIENAVHDLIIHTLKQLSLTKENCTLVGFSKGGSAALYYGLKYDFRNILSSCPQIKIGTYLKDNWPRQAKHILGENYNSNDTIEIDHLIQDLLDRQDITHKNIYLITSKDDEQYYEQVEPFLLKFIKCKNFNLIITKSSLAWQHNKVTKYNVPIILSIIYAHGEGIFPNFGYASNGVSSLNTTEREKILNKIRDQHQAVAKINKIKLEASLLHPDGIALIKGAECKDYNQIKHKMLFVKEDKTYEFLLGKNLNSDLSYQFFEQAFCDYSAAEITSIGKKGIDISLMDDGDYIIKCEIECSGVYVIKEMTSEKEINTQSNFHGKIATIYKFLDNIFLSINSLNKPIVNKVFEIKNKWITNNKLHYEGIFAIKGIEIKNWGDATYYLSLVSNNSTHIEKIGLSDNDGLNNVFDDHYGNYRKSYFCSIGSNGIDTTELIDGEYKVKVILNKKGLLFEEDTNDVLKKENGKVSFLVI